jgi:hypothetical protein
VGVGCLTLITSVPIFTVAMGGVLHLAWWITVEWGVTALMVELWNEVFRLPAVGYSDSELSSILPSRGVHPLHTILHAVSKIGTWIGNGEGGYSIQNRATYLGQGQI